MEKVKAFNEDVFQIVVRMASWNGAKWNGGFDCFSRDIVNQAKKLGFTVEYSAYSGKLFPAYRYGESDELEKAFNYVTKAKRNYRALAQRRERKQEKERAYFYNVNHHQAYSKVPFLKGSFLLKCASALRNLRAADKACDYPEMVYWAEALTSAWKERAHELQARMNYPEQVRYDLMGNDISGLPF